MIEIIFDDLSRNIIMSWSDLRHSLIESFSEKTKIPKSYLCENTLEDNAAALEKIIQDTEDTEYAELVTAYMSIYDGVSYLEYTNEPFPRAGLNNKAVSKIALDFAYNLGGILAPLKMAIEDYVDLTSSPHYWHSLELDLKDKIAEWVRIFKVNMPGAETSVYMRYLSRHSKCSKTADEENITEIIDRALQEEVGHQRKEKVVSLQLRRLNA
jgi:hypothetical protein